MKAPKAILYTGVFICSLLLYTSCEREIISDAPQEIAMASNDRYGNGGGGGGHEEGAGNNLSFPVVWSEGPALTLREPAPNAPGGVQLTGAWWYVWGPNPVDPQSPIYSCEPQGSDPCYPAGTPDVYKAWLQKDVGNNWKAFNAAASNDVYVDLVDWGDNLESIDWSLGSKVRTEVVLYESIPSTSIPEAGTMVTEFAMRHVSGWGSDEMQGLQTTLDGTIQFGPGNQATIYSPHARLTIQKINDTVANKTWDAVNHVWVSSTPGALGKTLLSSAVHESGEGPGFFNSEVNVKGKVIYGFNWDLGRLNDKAGVYRLTLSFDSYAAAFNTNLNTFIDGNTQLSQPEEEEEHEGGGKAVVDPINKLTYIDVTVTNNRQGRGRKPVN